MSNDTTVNPDKLDETKACGSLPRTLLSDLPTASDKSTSERLPYHVERTKTNNFPVYSDFKSHRTQKLTMVRRVTGDAHTLCRDLASMLNLEKGKYLVKHPSNIVVLKGRFKDEVIQFLRNKGF
jgi:large subunit ribosomal protein L49